MYTKIAPKVGLIHVCDTLLSDMYKDANGFRPRHYKTWWTAAELDAEREYLQEQIEYAIKRERHAENKALKAFRALIKKTVEYGAGDRLTAFKWLVQGEGLEWHIEDLKYFFWGHGISYELQYKWAKALTQ